MADWSAIRRLAREKRASLALPEPPEGALHAADAVLAPALEREGLWTDAVVPSDPALAGAQALLERDTQGILYDATLPREATRFNIAHELAHWFLHSDEPPAPCGAADIVADPVAEPLPYGQEAVSGYSPRQRRETEANVFAAEFLLPAPALRTAFLAGDTFGDIAAATGLTEPAVLGQLAETLLTSDACCVLREQSDTGPTLNPQPSTLNLDASQLAAATLDRGPALVVAGPGTGKTRTLVARILHLLEQGVPPERILALTFSNKAANEMRERLADAVPDAARRLWIGTFHAFGLELLRRYGTRLGLPPAPALVDQLDAIALLERHVEDLDLREYAFLHDPIFPFRDILSAISRAKDEMVTPEQYAELAGRMETLAEDEAAQQEAVKAREVARVYAAWQHILQREGKLDFGDLLLRAVELLTAHPDVLAEVRAQYPQVLVDEYQDVNRVSAVLVRLVAGEGAGLWAVGDLRQAIYQFRGASPANVAQFEEDFPGGRRVSLDVNYRSRAPIVRLFGEAAGSADWHAQRGEGENADAIITAVADDEEAQADGIAQSIRRFEARGFALRDQAVLCRTNAQAEAMAARLEARGVPVVFLGDLLARPEVRDMLALLSLACEATGQGLYRVARFPEYVTPPDTVRALLARAHEEGRPFPGALAGCGVPALERLYAHLQPVAHHGDAYAFFTRYLFGPADYLRRLLREHSPANRQRLLALHQLLLLARGLSARLGPMEERPQCAFLAHVRRLIATGEDGRARTPAGEEEIEGVRLLTVHAAKGLEFPVVFLPNLAKEMFPPRGRTGMVKLPPGVVPEPAAAAAGADEEARLFFVALSRARDHLVLSRPATVNGKPRDPSYLLTGLEPALTELGAERAHWHGVRCSASGVRADEPDTEHRTPNTEHPLPAVELYQRCPRRYFYEHELDLPRARDETAWGLSQRCVRDAKRWVRAERAAGRAVDAADALAKLDEAWRASELPGRALERALRARAEAIVAEFAAVAGETQAPPQEELVAELPSGHIRVPLDYASETEDGGITVERHEAGRRAEMNHTDPRLALLRQAARQSRPGCEVKIVLRHLPTGTTRDVPEQPRYEPKRVQKYEDALRGIARGEFEPRPSDECAGCPFLFICPA